MGVINLDGSPQEIETALSTIGRDIRGANEGSHVGSLESSWAQNLKHLSGLLIDATRETLGSVSGAYKHRYSTAQRRSITGEPVALNLVLPRASRFIARHLDLMGGVKAMSGQDNREAVNQAKALAKIGQGMWDNRRLDIAAMRAMVYMLACYRGYVLVEGDPTKDLRRDDQDRNPSKGDVIAKAITSFQVTSYPNHDDIQDSPAVVIVDFLDGDEIKRRWPTIKIPDDAKPAAYGVQMMDELSPGLDKVAYCVRRLFLKKSEKRPNGAHHIFMGTKKVFSEEKMPTYDGRYPLVEFPDAPISFGRDGFGRQTAARTIIKILCATWSRMVQCGVGMSGIWVDIPENSDISRDEGGNPSYKLIYRNPQGGPVGFNAIPRMPHHEALIELCIRFLDEIYAQGPASRGQAPGTRFPAKGLEFLAQQDVLADTPTGKMALKAMKELIERSLGEGIEVWDDNYVEYILGEGHEPEKIALDKKKLGKGWKIFLVPGSGTLQSKVAQRGEINEAVAQGILTPVQGRELGGYYVDEAVMDPARLQERLIDMEEEAFENGEGVEVNDYDDHPFHIDGHKRNATARHGLASGFEEWRRWQHLAKHLQAADQQQQAILADQQAEVLRQKAMEQQAAAAVTPPEPGAGAPPGAGPAIPPAGPPAGPVTPEETLIPPG
jgi:hypothetical protein